MVTKLADGRGQITVKGHEITDEWEQLIKAAAQRNGQTVADFVVTLTREGAQRMLKGETVVPAALPARQEDMRDLMREMLGELRQEQASAVERLAQEQAAAVERLAQEQRDAVARLERQSRQGRWRR